MINIDIVLTRDNIIIGSHFYIYYSLFLDRSSKYIGKPITTKINLYGRRSEFYVQIYSHI